MDEHLEAWQIAEHIRGGLDADELEEVNRHLGECPECVGWLAGITAHRLGVKPSGLRILAQR